MFLLHLKYTKYSISVGASPLLGRTTHNALSYPLIAFNKQMKEKRKAGENEGIRRK